MSSDRCATTTGTMSSTDTENGGGLLGTRPLRLQRIPDAPQRWNSFASTASNISSASSYSSCKTPAPMLASFASSPWVSGGGRSKAVILGSHSTPPKHRRVFDYSSFPHPHPASYTDNTNDEETPTYYYSHPPLTPPHRPTIPAHGISPLTSSSYSFLLEHRDGELSGYSYTPPEYYTSAYDIPFASLFPSPPSLDMELSPYISPIQHHHYSPLVRVDLRNPEKKYTEQKKRVSVRLIVSKLKKQQQQQRQGSPLVQSHLPPPPLPTPSPVKKNNAKRRRIEEEEEALGDEDASGDSDPDVPESLPPVTPIKQPNEREKRLLKRQKKREESKEPHSQSSSSSSPFVLTGRTIYSVASSSSSTLKASTDDDETMVERFVNMVRPPVVQQSPPKRPHADTISNEKRNVKRVKDEEPIMMSPLTPLPITPIRQLPPPAQEDEEEENEEPLPIREFPPVVEEIRPDVYERFYRRFWVSSFAISGKEKMRPPPSATANAARSYFDLYTPRFTKGRGPSKLGLCPICIEPKIRGGEGRAFWGAMKVSAYNYHMQYYHGISPQSFLPFSPPLAFRLSAVQNPAKTEKKEITEGRCHKCDKWVAVDGVKDVEVKVRELFWWKHAAMCHRGSRVEDEGTWESGSPADGDDQEGGEEDGEKKPKGRGRGVWVEDELWEEVCRLTVEEEAAALALPQEVAVE